MVYVIQEQKNKNILPAREFGEIKTLLPPDQQVSFSAGQVAVSFDNKLSSFCDDDHLLLIGDPIAIGIATAVAAKWNQGRVKLLKWDRQEKRYFVVSINIYQKGDDRGRDKF